MDESSALPKNDRGIGRWLRLTRKELREILRDRRTILTLVLMPLLLYPLLGFGLASYRAAKEQTGTAPQYKLGFESETEGQRFRRLLNRGMAVWREHNRKPDAPGGPTEDAELNFLFYVVDDDLEGRLLTGELDLAIRVRPTKRPGRDEPLEYEILHNADSAEGNDALRFVRGRMIAANLGLVEEAFRQVAGEGPVRSVRLFATPVRPEARRKGFLLAALVPLILILMTITGAVYPAIDLTAGERERGTLEMLMATPISRVGLLGAKYLAVLTVAVLTAFVNLAMMAVSILVFGGGLLGSDAVGFSLVMMPIVLGLVLLFAAFYSAVLLVLSSFARSFKEAQAYVVPLMLVSLVPGLLALVPDFELSLGVALVPLLNIVLLARDLLSGGGDWLAGLLVVASTLLYAVGALVLAARTFGAEAVLYRDARTWTDLIHGR